MKNETKWNTELALELESLFYKDSVPEEWIEVIDKLERRWQGIANLIGFDYTDEDVVKKIEDFFPVTDEKSPLHIFDDAEEAIDFFQDMRTIKARRAWLVIRTTKESYSPSVQALIKICCEIIDASPVEYHQRPNIALENMITCMSMAIGANDITYDVLRLFYKIIHDLEKRQADYIAHLNNKNKARNISTGKQERVNWRKKCFDDFGIFFQKRHDANPKYLKKEAAKDFFEANCKDKMFTDNWRDADSFYNSYLKRNQDSKNKNRKRLEEQLKQNTHFELSPDIIDVLSKW